MIRHRRRQAVTLADLLEEALESEASLHAPAPERIADYRILREIGRGGMGVVYEAKQKSLNRRVALKVLSTALGLSTKAIKRFKREAEAAAKLHHTNIVPIYATGDENRTPYYAMELVDGPSLDQVIRQLRKETDEPSLDSSHAFTDRGRKL